MLTHITPSHLYSLFSNALDNAIEAVKIIDDINKKVISLSIIKDNNQIQISLINFYLGEIKLIDGLPTTTKNDINKHGFGIKSMNYITKEYNGNLCCSTKNNVFTLQINLPCSK